MTVVNCRTKKVGVSLTIHIEYDRRADRLGHVVVPGTTRQNGHKVRTVEGANVELVAHQTVRTDGVAGVEQTRAAVPVHFRRRLACNITWPKVSIKKLF